jgi:glycerol-3-phosphate dehydrogenase
VYDIVIIGAGAVGCSVARFLSRYKANVCVVEKAEDVCCGTSKANSAIVHAGFDAANGSLMAEYNLKGNLMFPGPCKGTGFPVSAGRQPCGMHERKRICRISGNCMRTV